MKKNICKILFLLIVLLGLFVNRKNDTAIDKAVTKQNILEQGKYYCIYKGPLTEVTYHIYNSEGEIVLEETTDRPLEIAMIGNYIVDVSTGFGTGIIEHRYYDVATDCFSKGFFDVIACCDELIAYIGGENQERKIVVENIFDYTLFYKEYKLELSEIPMPINEASFENKCSVLKVNYISGEEQLEEEIFLELQ